MELLPQIKVDDSKITLWGSKLTDDNVVAVFSKLPKRKRILMVGSSLGDKGIEALLGSGFITEVQMLVLFRSNIGDEGAVALVKSSKYNNLVNLHLLQNTISADGLITMAEHLPGTKIITLFVSVDPVVTDTRVVEAFYQAALKHKILEDCDVRCVVGGEDACRRLRLVIIDNRHYIIRVTAELLEAVTFHGLEQEMIFPTKTLGADILKKFEQFYFNPVRRCKLIEKDPVVCRRIMNYISENYFRITGIVCDLLQCDNTRHTLGSSACLASLPPEVLRDITKFLKITDVKTESE